MKRISGLALVVLPALALAQTTGGAKIERGLTSAASWLVGIGLLIGTIGLIYAGIRMNTGDEEGKAIGQRVMVGSIIIVSASGLMSLLKTWFA
jgi:hypothetical protein